MKFIWPSTPRIVTDGEKFAIRKWSFFMCSWEYKDIKPFNRMSNRWWYSSIAKEQPDWVWGNLDEIQKVFSLMKTASPLKKKETKRKITNWDE